MIELFSAAVFGFAVLCGNIGEGHTYTTASGYSVMASKTANAYYVPTVYIGGGIIVIDDAFCSNVVRFDRVGRRLIAHELTHAWQDMERRYPFDEGEARQIAAWARDKPKRWWWADQ